MFLRFFFFSGFTVVFALRCYEGSRGIVNGEDSKNFVENLCDDNMTYCFESYNTNLTEVTASCQSMGTDPKLLEVCKLDGKCKERSGIDVTVCCCTADLCNLQDDLKPSIDIDDNNSTLTISSTDKFAEINETEIDYGTNNQTTLDGL